MQQEHHRTPTSSGKLARKSWKRNYNTTDWHWQNTHLFRNAGQVILEMQLEYNRLTKHPPLQECWPGEQRWSRSSLDRRRGWTCRGRWWSPARGLPPPPSPPCRPVAPDNQGCKLFTWELLASTGDVREQEEVGGPDTMRERERGGEGGRETHTHTEEKETRCVWGKREREVRKMSEGYGQRQDSKHHPPCDQSWRWCRAQTGGPGSGSGWRRESDSEGCWTTHAPPSTQWLFHRTSPFHDLINKFQTHKRLTKQIKKTIYEDKIQHANFQGNPLYWATKQHLNNS